MWRETGMWLLLLIVMFIFGRMWFHLVEGLLSKLKSLLGRHRDPPVWHTFEEADSEQSGSRDEHSQERRH